MTQTGHKPPRNVRALAHRFLFHWRDDARRMTAIEADLHTAVERVARLEAEVVELRAEVIELREHNLRIAELVDLAEQQLTPALDRPAPARPAGP